MLHRRTLSAATAFVTAVAFTATTATSASARSIIDYWPRETVYVLGPGGSYVAEWMGASTGWTTIGGPAENMYAGSAGLFVTDPTTGDIEEYNGTPGSWTVIGGPGSEFVQSDGHLYGLGPGQKYVAEWNGTPGGGWTIIGGPAGNIYGGAYGLIATSPGEGDDGSVFYYNGTPGSWTDIGAVGYDFAVGTTAIYRLNEDGDSVSQWTGGTTWTSVGTPSGQPVAIDAAGDEGLVVQVGINDVDLRYNGTPGSWTQIGEGYDSPGAEAESLTSLYGIEYDNASETTVGVYVYSGSGANWTFIGAPYSPGIAAED
ncbi:MAG TPA: hypothetical protein VL551_12595 [Actinospica sp.]|jgi:hypothetical protein|nr:hypothetical protein [Actinospica sp.]